MTRDSVQAYSRGMNQMECDDILRFRLARQWTQAVAAVHLGVAQGTLCKVERGIRVTPLTLAKIRAGMARVLERESAAANEVVA